MAIVFSSPWQQVALYDGVVICFYIAIFGNEQANVNLEDLLSDQISNNRMSAEFKKLQKILSLSQNNVFIVL